VVNTAEVGTVVVTGTESKGKGNKRIRVEVREP
jgi:Ser-tRNA(Ala) deacylase AlaX